MKLTNREKIIRFKSYYQKTKCGLCEALCISKVTLIFIYMKSKKKKIHGLHYIPCFYVVKN